MLKAIRLISAIFLVAISLDSCKNKSMLQELYKNTPQSNVHWRYYLYDKEVFLQSVELIDTLLKKNDKSGIKQVIDILLDNIDKDNERIRANDSFLLFMKYVNNNDSANKYIGLYYNLAKSKLTNLKDSISQTDSIENLDELKEYYVRYKASVFFKESWFYVTKYHITEAFFKLFINEEIYNHLSYPDKSTIYLSDSMYMNIIFSKTDAERIIKNVQDKQVVPNDFLINDSVFFEGLQGIIDGKYIIVYNND